MSERDIKIKELDVAIDNLIIAMLNLSNTLSKEVEKPHQIIFESTLGHEHCSKCGDSLYATRGLHNEWVFLCWNCLQRENR